MTRAVTRIINYGVSNTTYLHLNGYPPIKSNQLGENDLNKLTLTRLTLKNFKGCRNFTLDTQGFNCRVFGDNGTFKSTLFDAFVWNLFDKDSNNKKDFALKTLDSKGKELHGLEHEVETEFLFNGQPLTLRKVFTEKWTKKRGSATQEFTGHTTDYYIDGVPVQKKEYSQKIDSIVQEDIFKLLTSPSYFNEQVKWQDRRKTLLEICGDIADEEVISSDSSLAALPAILQGRSIENHRKVIAARRSEINKELDKIPVRIDEIQRNLPSLDDLNKQAIDSEINRLNGEIDEKATLINNIRNGSAISAKQKDIQEIEIAMLQLKQDHQANSNEKVYSLKTRLQEEKSNINILQAKVEGQKQRKHMNENNISSLTALMNRLRSEWEEINNEEFYHEADCNCPTCGQSLPEEQLQSARDKALASFNKSKSDRLERLSKQGKDEKANVEKLKASNATIDQEIQKIEGQLLEKKELVTKLQEQLSTVESTIVDILENPEYVAKLQAKNKIVEEIRGLREAADQSIQSIYGEVAELKAKRDSLQGDLGKFVLADQSKKRIDELMGQERELAAEFEKLEGELYLTEEFIRTKVNLLEQKINGKFKYARFKLFEQQINGGLSEVCETLFDGVPYSSGLNNAAKINVGLDIINTLSEHYGFSAPIFIDNSEAVTKLIDTKAQTVCLVVSEQDKVLRVEYQDNDLIPVDIEVIA
jgi:DNA repair exonuclease SbcCD ATPase subunit